MTEPIAHPTELASNAERAAIAGFEPRSLRTFTPSQAVLARSAGVFHWTPEGRRLYDYTSGVLVSNLGHNPNEWARRFFGYMGWSAGGGEWSAAVVPPVLRNGQAGGAVPPGYFAAVPLTAYNAITPIETEASRRLLATVRRCPGGGRLTQVMWAASGSEAVQKAIWTGLARDPSRPMILATRYGFHGKKGLAGATTGCESDPERDPRVKFVSFPTAERADVTNRHDPFDVGPYRKELDAAWVQYGRRLGVLVTEPYLGGGGSFHPPAAYLRLLQDFCRERDVVFVLDEVQANFGRTGPLFAFEKYGLEPDVVVLGKGLGNGGPVAAAVGRRDLFAALDYGAGSDTWSANPLACAAVLATLDEFERWDVLGHACKVSAVIEAGLLRLKALPFVAHVRGEEGGMVWGVEARDYDDRSAAEWANLMVLAAYRGDGAEGVHLLGPLAKKVVRIAPPLVITEAEARASLDLLERCLKSLAGVTQPATVPAPAKRVPVVAPSKAG